MLMLLVFVVPLAIVANSTMLHLLLMLPLLNMLSRCFVIFGVSWFVISFMLLFLLSLLFFAVFIVVRVFVVSVVSAESNLCVV